VNIDSIPEMDAIPDELALPVLLKVGDDISTDDIVPAGTRVLPFWSNIERVGDFVFETVDDGYPRRARENRGGGGGHASSPATTTGRDRAGRTPRSRRATSACAWCWPGASPASTGRTWPTSASCR
jgi:aconitate hydratase